MSSFPLQTNTRSWLNGHDLQTLRDYALQAPWEWRLAFEELIDSTEKHYESADLIARIDDLHAAQARAIKVINLKIDTLGNALVKGSINRGVVEEVVASVRAALTVLEQAATTEEDPKTP